MTGGPDLVESTVPPPAPRSPRSAKRRLAFVSLAGLMAVLGIAAAAYYFAMRPETLRVAVGTCQQRRPQGGADAGAGLQQPAQQPDPPAAGADRRRNRQRPGARRRQGRPRHHPRRSRRAEERAGRRHAAQERRRALGAAAGQGQGQEGAAEDHQDRAARRPPHRRDRPHAGQRQSAEGDPAGNTASIRPRCEIIQFPANEAAEAIRNQKADAYIAAGPVNSKITTDAIIASTRDGGTPTILAIDLGRSHRAEPSGAMRPPEIPAGSFGSVPEEEIKTISFAHHIVARKGLSEGDRRRLHPAVVRDPASAEERISARGQDRDARHRQGRHRSPRIPALPPLSTARKRPSSTATATSSGGG